MNAARKVDDQFTPDQAEKKTLAVLQLTRFGDVIQTYQAALELKEQHPHLRLILIARKKFSGPLGFLLKNVFDKVYALDFPELAKSDSLSETSKRLTDFIAGISAEKINVLVNLSFSKSSAYMAQLIKADHKLGMVYDERNQLHLNDTWSQYVYSNVMGSAFNGINLVDIFKFIFGVRGTKTALPMENTKITKRIVVHAFASNAKKRWRSTKWIEVLFKILRENDQLEVVLVGDKNEQAAAEQIRTAPVLDPFVKRIRNEAGKMNLEGVSQLFTPETIFIGHDSMVGHLAALNRSRIITISLGTVRPSETTPYISGAYNIAPRSKCFPCFPQDNCDLHQCHADIPYQVVAGALGLLIKGEEVNAKTMVQATSLFHLSSVDIFKTEFSSADLLDIKSQLNHEPLLADVFRQVLRVTWLYSLGGVEENQNFPQLSSNGHKELLNRMAGLQYLFELCEFGKKYSRYILEEISSQVPSLGKIKDFSKKIDEIDSLQALVKKTHPQLAPIVDYFAVAKGNLSGENLVELTESSFVAFEDSRLVTSVVYDLLEKIVAEYKIKTTVGKMSKEEYHR